MIEIEIFSDCENGTAANDEKVGGSKHLIKFLRDFKNFMINSSVVDNFFCRLKYNNELNEMKWFSWLLSSLVPSIRAFLGQSLNKFIYLQQPLLFKLLWPKQSRLRCGLWVLGQYRLRNSGQVFFPSLR